MTSWMYEYCDLYKKFLETEFNISTSGKPSDSLVQMKAVLDMLFDQAAKKDHMATLCFLEASFKYLEKARRFEKTSQDFQARKQDVLGRLETLTGTK